MPNRTIFQRAEISHRANWNFYNHANRSGVRVWACNDCGHKVFVNNGHRTGEALYRWLINEVARHEATCGNRMPVAVMSRQPLPDFLRQAERGHRSRWNFRTDARRGNIRIWTCKSCNHRVFTTFALSPAIPTEVSEIRLAEDQRNHLREVRRHEQGCAQAHAAI